MIKLNSKAEGLKSKYIKKSSDSNVLDNRKKVGLQQEIQKIESIIVSLRNKRVNDVELLRFRSTVQSLVNEIEHRISP